jgi:hypothetical protein
VNKKRTKFTSVIMLLTKLLKKKIGKLTEKCVFPGLSQRMGKSSRQRTDSCESPFSCLVIPIHFFLYFESLRVKAHDCVLANRKQK